MRDRAQQRKPVTVTVVRNPLEPVASRTVAEVSYIGNGTVRDYIPHDVKLTPNTLVTQNGHLIAPERWEKRPVLAGDFVTVTCEPGIVFSLGAAVTATVTTAKAGAAAFGGASLFTTIGAFALKTGAMLAASFGLSYLASQFIDQQDDPDEPETTGPGGQVRTQQLNGAPRPVVYGERIVGGNIIRTTTGHVTGRGYGGTNYNANEGAARNNVTLGLCEGPVQSIASYTAPFNKRWFGEAGESEVILGELGKTYYTAYALYNTSNTYLAAGFYQRAKGSEHTAYINAVTFRMRRGGPITSGNVVCKIFRGTGSGLSAMPDTSKLVGQSEPIAASTIGTGWHDLRFRFPQSVRIPYSTGMYFAVLDATYTPHASNNVHMAVWNGSPVSTRVYTGSWGNGSGRPICQIGAKPPQYRNENGEIKVNGNEIESFSADGYISTRLGTSEQLPLPMSSGVSGETTVDVTMLDDREYEETTTNATDDLGWTIYYPNGFWRYKNDGSKAHTPVEVFAWWRPENTTAWVGHFYEKRDRLMAPASLVTYRVDVDEKFRGQKLDIKLKVKYRDSAQGSIVWKTVREFSDDYQAQSFPHLACLQVDTDLASATGDIDDITVRVEGKKMWTWDGSAWTYEYSDNPADCCLDWLLNTRYGGGRRLTVDDVYLDEFADWRDECTAEGREIGLIIDQRRAFWDWATTIASVGRAKLVRRGNKIGVVLQKEQTPAYIFTAGNAFNTTVEYLGRDARPNVVEVRFADRELDFAENVVSADRSGIREGDDPDLKEEINFEGCTSIAQAKAHAEYQLNLAEYVNWTGELTTGIEGLPVQAGDAVIIGHALFNSNIVGGRLKNDGNVGNVALRLDRSITITGTDAHLLSVRSIKDDGTYGVRTRTIIEDPGTYAAGTNIDVDSSWIESGYTSTVQAGDIWTMMPQSDYNATGGELAVVTSTEVTEDLLVKVKFAQSDPRIFSRVPGKVKQLPPPKPNDPRVIPPSVTGLTLTASALSSNQQVITATWNKADWPIPYKCQLRGRIVDPLEWGDRFHVITETAGATAQWVGDLQGEVIELAVCPMAPATGQVRHPERETRVKLKVRRTWNPARAAQPSGVTF